MSKYKARVAVLDLSVLVGVTMNSDVAIGLNRVRLTIM